MTACLCSLSRRNDGFAARGSDWLDDHRPLDHLGQTPAARDNRPHSPALSPGSGNGISPAMLNVVMELGNAEAIEMDVGEGSGVAFVSRLAAARGLALGSVVEVQVCMPRGLSPPKIDL